MSDYRPPDHGHCESWEEMLSAAEAGRSPPEEHLRTCSRCREMSGLVRAVTIAGARAASAATVEECPDGPAWAALADGAVDAEARLAMAEHLAICSDCALLWNHLMSLDDPSSDDEWEVREPHGAPDIVTRADPSTRVRWHRGLRSVAAVLGGALVLSVLWAWPFPGGESDDGEVWRGPAATLAVDFERGGEDGPTTLGWRSIPGTTMFRVRMWDSGGDQVSLQLVEVTGAAEYAYTFSEAELLRLAIWQVDALDDTGVLASSGPVEVRDRVP